MIKWLKDHSSIKPSMLLKRGGELESEYRAIAPTRCFAEEFEKINGGLHRRVLRKLQLSSIRQPDLSRLYPPEEYPVVYANTIDCCDMVLQLSDSGRHIIHHIHELSYITNVFGATEKLKRAISITDSYIAVSHAVREHLETTIGVPKTKIYVIHGFPIAVGKEIATDETKQIIRQRLNIPNNAFVVGMCGLPQWRKGTDLFAQLVMHVKRHIGLAKCHFVWLGGDLNSHRQALHDVTQMGLRDTCHFIPAVPNPREFFSAFDLFALTSREDPFSVAMLEAAASGLPIVCFADAGGAPELVEDDAGIVVPYLDIPAMAKACVELLTNEHRRAQLGKAAQTKVQERYVLALQGPKLLAVIESAIGL
ncbi:MAG: glycosyltransferase family 4 protein [Verrucomicrobiota bacterium]